MAAPIATASSGLTVWSGTMPLIWRSICGTSGTLRRIKRFANALADRVSLDCDGYHIVVFNPLAHARTDHQQRPLRRVAFHAR